MLITNLLGIALLFFLLWKRLKDDYHYEKIFNLVFIVFFGLVISYFVASQFAPVYWFWIQTLFIAVSFSIGIIKQKMKFFESLDAFVIGLLPWLGLTYLADAINKSSLSSFLAFWITLIFVFLFFFLDSQYRKFSWYKSGRVGFAGVTVAALFFVARIALFLIYPQTMSFAGDFELYFSGTFAFSFFLLLYRLSTS